MLMFPDDAAQASSFLLISSKLNSSNVQNLFYGQMIFIFWNKGWLLCKIFFFQIDFGEVYFFESSVRTVNIKNTGKTKASFWFVPRPDRQNITDSWLSVTPPSSHLRVGASCLLSLQVLQFFFVYCLCVLFSSIFYFTFCIVFGKFGGIIECPFCGSCFNFQTILY